jgi:hypothetical protein
MFDIQTTSSLVVLQAWSKTSKTLSSEQGRAFHGITRFSFWGRIAFGSVDCAVAENNKGLSQVCPPRGEGGGGEEAVK